MKRLIALLMAATMMVSLAACSSEEGSGDKDTAGGENEDGTRTVVVGTNGSGEPYSLVADDGTWTGVEAELWAEVGERTGWEIEVKQVGDAASLFGELDTGRVDVAANCFAITEARLENYLASPRWSLSSRTASMRPWKTCGAAPWA